MMSVPARVRPAAAMDDPGVLSWAICSETFVSSSGGQIPRLIAVEMIPVPMGLVRRRRSPGFAPAFEITFSG